MTKTKTAVATTFVRRLQAIKSPDKVEYVARFFTGGEPGRTIATGVAGFKWNPGGTLVVAAHLRWTLNSTGLTAPLTPSLGLEYAF